MKKEGEEMAKKEAKEKKRIVIGNKEYAMPKMDVDSYMHYLEVRDGIMETENKSGLYTRKQFSDMMECICEVYGNQFTVEELKDRDTGLSVGGIVMEFASIDVAIADEVNAKVRNMQENFTNGK